MELKPFLTKQLTLKKAIPQITSADRVKRSLLSPIVKGVRHPKISLREKASAGINKVCLSKSAKLQNQKCGVEKLSLLSTENLPQKLKLSLRKSQKAKSHKVPKTSEMKNIIKAIVSSKRGRRNIRTHHRNTCKRKSRRVFSAEPIETDQHQMDEEDINKIMEVHNRMIKHVNLKLRQNKIMNGRFFSPHVLRQKASIFQRLSDSSNTEGSDIDKRNDAIDEERKLPLIKDCSSTQ
ncbi:unnamed protein product [Moneuplotes crassus]|uniref:Uncharacterized protein n=1 Tax=Euplotes crassus TaxID=5936 RepID=A0AAD1UBH4_EUPCR|nr:unnamed protein product [Moneuplotes crassus]CAI2364222.1 unnamed protein product [Moneuplotes crassus]